MSRKPVDAAPVISWQALPETAAASYRVLIIDADDGYCFEFPSR